MGIPALGDWGLLLPFCCVVEGNCLCKEHKAAKYRQISSGGGFDLIMATKKNSCKKID